MATSKPGAELLRIIKDEFNAGDVIGLFVGEGQVVEVEVRAVDLERGILLGKAWPKDNAIAFRGSCIRGIIELLTYGEDEEDEGE